MKNQGLPIRRPSKVTFEGYIRYFPKSLYRFLTNPALLFPRCQEFLLTQLIEFASGKMPDASAMDLLQPGQGSEPSRGFLLFKEVFLQKMHETATKMR
jgi:hypothetical protein